MSSDPPSDGPSPPPEASQPPASEPGHAGAVALLGGALLDALDDHLPGARAHAGATGDYASVVAVSLTQDREHSELVREAAKLHDVGMVYVPANVLRTPAGQLSDADRALLGTHIEAGAQLARGAGHLRDGVQLDPPHARALGWRRSRAARG